MIASIMIDKGCECNGAAGVCQGVFEGEGQ